MSKQPAIELKNITKRCGTKVVANKNVNLTAYRGEILSILGENGSGKIYVLVCNNLGTKSLGNIFKFNSRLF